MGPCAGGAVYSPAITDFTLMVDQTSHMFITGPDVIKTVTGEEVSFEELGGAHTHNTKSGVAHYQAADEEDAIDYARDAAVLPALQQPGRPARSFDRPVDPEADLEITESDLELDTLIPDSANQPYDMHAVIEHVLDDGEFLEVHAAVRAEHRGRLRPGRGAPVGVVANQPMHFAGTPGHRRLGEGGPVRPDLRRVQHPGADLRRRARLPARHRPGVGRHHPARRQADLRLRGGDRAHGHGDHPQGVRRRLRRDGLQAPRRRTSTSPGRRPRSR